MDSQGAGPLILSVILLLTASPPLAAQRTEHGAWYHVARTDTGTLANTSYAATVAQNGAGGMVVLCGALNLPVVAFLHPPLAGTASEAGVRLLLEHDSVTAWRDGDVDGDRRSTRVSYRLLELIRLQASEDDRIRVRIEASDTTDAVELLFAARGLGDAVQRLDCVRPAVAREAMTVRPRLVNENEVARALDRYYPATLRSRGIGGTVNVRFFIDRNGRVTEAHVNEPSPHGAFNEAALEVAKIMMFTPAYHDGEAVPVWVAFDVTFEVQRW